MYFRTQRIKRTKPKSNAANKNVLATPNAQFKDQRVGVEFSDQRNQFLQQKAITKGIQPIQRVVYLVPKSKKKKLKNDSEKITKKDLIDGVLKIHGEKKLPWGLISIISNDTKKTSPDIKVTSINDYYQLAIDRLNKKKIDNGINLKKRKYNELRSSTKDETVKKVKKPKKGEKGYVFKPQSSGKMYNTMRGVENANKTLDSNFHFGHEGIDREADQTNLCGANNIIYIKKAQPIDQKSLHEELDKNQQSASFISNWFLKDSGLKTSMTELQIMTTDGEGGKKLSLGGNSDLGNTNFRTYLNQPMGKNPSTLDEVYDNKFRAPNKKVYLEDLSKHETDIQMDIDNKMSAIDLRKKYRYLANNAEFRKRRILKNVLKAKSKKTTSDLKANREPTVYGKLPFNVPENKDNIHSETNLLNKAIADSREVIESIGTKVPCLSCFAAFCQKNIQQALLPYFGYLWVSKSSVKQHDGHIKDLKLSTDNKIVKKKIDEKKMTIEDIEAFIHHIKACLGTYDPEKDDNYKRYTGKMGNINANFDDDDSGSEGDEIWEHVHKKKKFK